MKICMVGSGYVGLVNGAGLAEWGHDVICVDSDAEKIARLQRGEVPIYEPGLDAMIERNSAAGRLSFSTDVAAAIAASKVVYIGVGTPSRPDGGANLQAVDAVTESVAQHVSGPTVLVVKSTVPVGTNQRVARIVANAAHPIHPVSNPEFLKEGDAINDFMKPDRIVIGVRPGDDFARTTMERVHQAVSLDKARIVWMDPASAELTKYVANTMLAMRVSFMNEVAELCEAVGADVHHVRLGIGSDQRIGSKFLYAGPGFGGSCFPKDVIALVHTARENGMEVELANTINRVNERHRGILARKLKRHFDGDIRGRRIGIWGLAFKPRTDDIRESPALRLVDALLADGAQVVAHDPEAMDNTRAIYGDRLTLVDDAYEVARDAEALVLATEWRQYQNPDFDRVKELMKRPLLIDGRNRWSQYGLREQGFTYEGFGVHGS